MTRAERRELARKLYLAGNGIDEIAQALGLSRRTVQNYKAADGDWDKARSDAMLSHGGERIYENFVEFMHDFLREIREADLKPEVRVEKISQLGDAFAKMRRVAQQEDPELYKRGIIKAALTTLILHAKKRLDRECLLSLVSLIEDLDEELADVAL